MVPLLEMMWKNITLITPVVCRDQLDYCSPANVVRSAVLLFFFYHASLREYKFWNFVSENPSFCKKTIYVFDNENFLVLPLFKTTASLKIIGGGGLAPPFAPPSARHCSLRFWKDNLNSISCTYYDYA